MKVTPVGDPVQENQCSIPDPLTDLSCNVTFKLTFNVTVDFYPRDDQAAAASLDGAGCPANDSILLDTETFQGSQEVTQFVTTKQVVEGILQAVGSALWQTLTGDIVSYAHGNIAGCAWTAAWFVPTSKVLGALKLVAALADAMRSGKGIDEALSALKAAQDVPALTLSNLEA